jgi:diadenosine tetraphosphate (Ap4A) HIT family hydrolase
MPERITKEEALARVAAAVPPGTCAVCHVVATEAPLAARGAAVLTFNRFPLRWGHLLVAPRRHVTSFLDLGDAEHADAAALSLAAARAVEQAISPARVYVASLGAAQDGLPMTSPHLHWHVVPVASPDDRPSEVLTWSAGVLAASTQEWSALHDEMARALLRVGGAGGGGDR